MEQKEEIAARHPVPPVEKKETMKESVLDFVRFVVLALAIVIPIRLFIAQPFIVSGASMVPSFESGHYLIIDELSYRFDEPKRGDVVVFRFPAEQSKFLIKRVAGLPGETLEIQGDIVTIKSEGNPSGFEWQQGEISESRNENDLSVTLEQGEYFVLGDNRAESADSRLWGPLKREFIVGRPLVRLFPFSKLGIFPGSWKAERR
ncbi:MAG: signal peptidase I [Candidatus Taylorbacteria bacterium RIFCSPHIGHO2_01_FULL_51_15]|uniref:Signal peptidase I n=1 Tax=Candidatus Taylorbacteria bacterium RIFCSPHIGHO2_01_FULL_51_15 TaxID=1802304 RepID=A0A1G2MBU6_9BACT|nr:MAG: signal peptidase I [Candidatus Taylorbacteria bacterium RIFCSPHIGHO2_01_FULL_51_15]